MRKDNLAFLIGGLAYGVLIGFGIAWMVQNRPGDATATGPPQGVPSPQGPPAATQVGPGSAGGAPMVEEILALKRRLQDNPEDPAVLTRLANLYHDAGMWKQAVEYYDRALAIMPDNPDLLTDQGICYQGLEDFERALDLFARAQEADPSHWQSLYNTVVVAGLNLGQYDRAFAALEKLEQLNTAVPGIADLRHAVEKARERAPGGAP